MSKFDLSLDYIDVAARIVEFRHKHPEGSLQQHSLDFRSFAGKDWVVFTAAAYRTPDDARPGMGTAWEQVPGKTPFTRDSELQNAETAAWGRAIVAVLAADTKRGVASADEVRNRTVDRDAPPSPRDVVLTHHEGDFGAAQEGAARYGWALPADMESYAAAITNGTPPPFPPKRTPKRQAWDATRRITTEDDERKALVLSAVEAIGQTPDTMTDELWIDVLEHLTHITG